FFFSSRRRHTRFSRDWSSDVCSSDLFIDDGDAICDAAQLREFTGGKHHRYSHLIELHNEFQHPALGTHVNAPGRFRYEEQLGLRSEERRVGKESRARWRREETATQQS